MTRSRSFLAASLAAVWVTTLPGCQRARIPQTPNQPAPAPVRETSAQTEAPGSDSDPRVEVIEIPVDSPRWLYTENLAIDAPRPRVEGSFDPRRNKITIRTHDAQAFAIDTGRLPIDWDRLVILSIDGITSELRRREHPVIHFRLDRAGRWGVDDR